MTNLLDLPTELRLQILTHLPDFHPNRHETIGPNVRLTPTISRVCRKLRQDSLPLYAQTSSFVIQTDDHWTSPSTNGKTNRVHVWLAALGDDALSAVENLQLSQHWKLAQPSRWQGHVGFYVRLQRRSGGEWSCTCGTYPIANDLRGLRAESVGVLRDVVVRRLTMQREGEERRLRRADVEFVVDAMDVVASHPISAFDTEQTEGMRRRRRQIFETMEAQMRVLDDRTGG